MLCKICRASLTFLLPFFLTWEAIAQVPRSSTVGIQQSSTPGEPAFRDPKTGQVWTPSNVGHDESPVAPEDRAFDPRGQAVPAGPLVEERAQVEHVGNVPVRAGAAVSLVEIDNASLRVQPGGRWQVALYLENNSANAYSPVLGCQFHNGDKVVMNTRVLVPSTPGGDRIGVSFRGPPSDIYVDHVTCKVESP